MKPIPSRAQVSLDIVTSTLNEEQNIIELYDRITKVMESELRYSWRLIICDNNSQDQTWKNITKLASKDKRVLGIRLTRNFKLDNSLTCGLDHCTADVALFIASDLEEPPELLPKFLRLYEAGNVHVAALIEERQGNSKSRKTLTAMFYRLSSFFTKGLVLQNVSDFRLVDRSVYSSALALREKHRFLRGIFAWTGYQPTLVPITREKRKRGESSIDGSSLIHVIDQGLEWIYAFSKLPLKIVSFFGLLFGFLGFAALAILIFVSLTNGVPFAGFGSIMSLLLIGFAFNFIFLGILGTYIGQVADEIKNRPLYVIRETTFKA